ncbi:UNVERIFIED_CONTAM: hypothetical protein K2H54_048229 [Gekko kuhli]
MLTPGPGSSSRYDQTKRDPPCRSRVEEGSWNEQLSQIELWQARMARTIEEALMDILRLVAQAVQEEMYLQHPAPAPPAQPLPPPPRLGYQGTRHHSSHHLCFFATSKVEKFIMYWGHFFLIEECSVDYIATKLRERVADWYISLHNVPGPKLSFFAERAKLIPVENKNKTRVLGRLTRFFELQLFAEL